jgi:hypothetical protein
VSRNWLLLPALGLLIAGASAAPAAATPPTINSISRAAGAPNPTNASTLTFLVTFSETVFGFDPTDINLATTGTAIGDVTSVACPTEVCTVTVSNVSGEGDLRIDLLSNAGIKNGTDEPLVGGFTAGQTYRVDRTAPSAYTTAGPAPGIYRGGQDLIFTLNYSETVMVTGTPQLQLSVGGIQRSAQYLSGTGTSSLRFRYQVIAGDLAPSGVAMTGFDLNGGHITDAVGNEAEPPVLLPLLSSVLVDAVPPNGMLMGTAIGPDSATFTVSFNEPITGLGPDDFVLSGSAHPTGVDVTPAGGFASTITVRGMDAEGTVTLALPAGAVADAAGNASLAIAPVTLHWAPPALPPVTETPTTTIASAPPAPWIPPTLVATAPAPPAPERDTPATTPTPPPAPAQTPTPTLIARGLTSGSTRLPATAAGMRRLRVGFSLNRAATVTATVTTRGHRQARLVRHAEPGAHRLRLSAILQGRPLAPGAYRIALQAVDAAGRATLASTHGFRVIARRAG